jgi:hypothetical protein
MANYTLIGKHYIEIPKYLKITAIQPKKVLVILKMVVAGIDKDTKTSSLVDGLTLRDGLEVRVTTKISGGVIYWIVQDWFGRYTWAGGVFSYGRHEHEEDVAVALPALRGRGLYTAVLKYLRKTYKRPLLSDRTLSRANIMSWIRAGASVGSDRFRINPHKPWIKDFVALETVTL